MIRRCRPVAAIVVVFVLAAATTTSRSASTTTPFPDASNTGVPAGIVLTDYVGPTTVTQAGTVIDAKTIRGKLVIAADNVTIKRSKVLGTIDSDRPGSHVTILDSEIDGGKSQSPARWLRQYHDVSRERLWFRSLGLVWFELPHRGFMAARPVPRARI
jgi:hypothetical protein